MRALFFFLLQFFATFAFAETATHNWTFLMPGQYHDEEAPVNPGMQWLALKLIDESWHLVPARVTAERVHDPVVDADDQKTGIKIASEPEAIALFRLPQLRTGKVDTPSMSFKDSRTSLMTTQPLSLYFKDELYNIEVRGNEVYIRKHNMSTKLQNIVVGGPESDNSASLIWAGDLDGDGALDLLVEYSGYNQGGACLFLSSCAPSGALVKKVACHGGVGC